jgi:hypothetical protein
MRSSGGRGDLGPDCELTVILGRGLEGQWLLLVLPEEQLCGATQLVGWCNGDVWLPGGVDLCRSRARAVLSPSVIELSPSPL